MPGRSPGCPAFLTSPACRRRPTSRSWRCRRPRSSTRPTPAAASGCAVWWCSRPPSTPPPGPRLLAVCRRYGMRLIGPNCFGIAVPSIGLDATFAAANPRPGHGRPGHAVRRPRLRDGRPPHQARDRDLLVRVGRQQARRVEQRHAHVVGAGRADPGGRALHRVVRQPAQVRADRPPGRRADPGDHRARRAQRGGPARRRDPHRRPPPPRWSPGRRCSSRPGSSPPRASAS